MVKHQISTNVLKKSAAVKKGDNIDDDLATSLKIELHVNLKIKTVPGTNDRVVKIVSMSNSVFFPFSNIRETFSKV